MYFKSLTSKQSQQNKETRDFNWESPHNETLVHDRSRDVKFTVMFKCNKSDDCDVTYPDKYVVAPQNVYMKHLKKILYKVC